MAEVRLSENKVRVSITPTKEQCARIDEMAARLGMSRAATCCMLIGTALESFDSITKLSEEKLKTVIDALK